MVFRCIISEQATDREQAMDRLQLAIKLAEETIKVR